MTTPLNIGKYAVFDELGRGATSVVYRGIDPFTNRDVAIKVFNPAGFANDDQRRKFEKLFMTEAAMVGKLNHPHVVNIFDASVEGEQLYIVMELVRGTALDEHAVPDGLLPIASVMQIIFKCCTALDFAHRQGIIHRDIKPANIMLCDNGEIKITDFGAALMPSMEQTQLAGVGSPAYMSPEQVREENLTHQTDIYSLGVVLYRLLTGRFPYDADNAYALIHKIMNEAPHDVRALRPEISSELARIVHKAMEKTLAARYHNWADFASDLAACVRPARVTEKVITDSEKFNLLKGLSFFEGFTEVELWEVLRISGWRKLSAGTALVKEGNIGNSFFILADGEVRVTKVQKLLSTLKTGDCFGEMAYIEQTRSMRSASITAAGTVTLIKIKADALLQASDNLQLKFNRAFLGILVRRLAAANTELASLMA
ncbi:MAG TPA: serine/threonine-protein kinase [Novimethylophilus sp.]|uniref:serine/threonine-protein kinase n=1 Tax=Novimethylophilus sp. TaxID=2137426 RepID=UPI002F40FDAE